jgi:hypothetical protein
MDTDPARLPPRAPISPLYRFFGGSPSAVILRLALLSVIVGLILSVLGLDPWNILDSLERLLRWMLDLVDWVFRWISGSLETIWGWFVLGAVIVVPIWLIARILKVLPRR